MVIGFPEDFNAAGCDKGLEALEHIRGIALELLEGGAGNREGNAELPATLLDCVQKKLIHRKIALLGNAPQNRPVGEIIIIMGIFPDIEEPV